jgi:cytochrome P450
MTATRTITDLPGPKGLPLLGNVHQLAPPSRAHLTFEKWGERYGSIFRVRVGPQGVIAINDAEAINEILRDRPQGYRRWSEMQEIIEEMGDGPPAVFIAEGDAWKRQRRLVVTALNTNHLHRYFDVVRTSTERLRRRLLEKAARGSDPVSIGDDLSSYTVDVISALAFGYDLNTLERGEAGLQRHIQCVLTRTARRLTAPYPYWRRFKLPADRALDRSMAEVYRAVEGFIASARGRLAEQPKRYEEPENLLEGMLAAQREDNSFTDEEIANNVITLLFAGEDTTSHTLAWTAWLLATNPDVQERLAASTAEALGDDLLPTNFETVGRLDHAEATLQESMRLKSVAPLLTVEPLEDKVICGTRIPARTRLLLLTRQASGKTAGRSDEFYPERWLEDSDETRAPKSLNFGAGPRFCPGRNLAFLEAKSALAMIARNFELELDDSSGPVQESFDFAMAPSGLRVRLRERSAVLVG